MRIFDVERLSAFRQLEVEELGLREEQRDVLDKLGIHTNPDPGLVVRDNNGLANAVYISSWSFRRRRVSAGESSVTTFQR